MTNDLVHSFDHSFVSKMFWHIDVMTVVVSSPPFLSPRCGELRTKKLESHLLTTQSLKVLPLKPGEGQYIATHTTLPARNIFHANFYPSGPLICIVPKPLQSFSALAVAHTGSCVGPRNRIGHPAHRYRQLMPVPVLSVPGI